MQELVSKPTITDWETFLFYCISIVAVSSLFASLSFRWQNNDPSISTWTTWLIMCLCVRGESQQWLHLRLLWWNRRRPPADSVSDQRGGLQRGIPVCLQYEKGELSWACNVQICIFFILYLKCSLQSPINDLVLHSFCNFRKPTPSIGYKMTCQLRWSSRGWRSVSVYSERKPRGSTLLSLAAHSWSWWRGWVLSTWLAHPSKDTHEWILYLSVLP